MDINSAVGRDRGVADEKLASALDGSVTAAYSEEEKLVLELTEAITATPADVSDDLRARLKAKFSNAQLVELAATIAWENYQARSNRVFGFESEHFYK